MRKWLLAFALAVLSHGALAYQSTINPLLPVQNSPLQSAVVRGNFQAAVNDINNIYSLLPNPVGSIIVSGSVTPGDCVQFLTPNIVVDSGSACGGGGGGAVSSVTGTAGQVTVSPTTGAVIVSLPSTITEALTFSGAANFTSSFSISGTAQTFPTSGLIVGTSDTQTLTNKSIAGSEINSGTVSATFLPTATNSVLGVAQCDGVTTTCSGGIITSTGGGGGGTLVLNATTSSIAYSGVMAAVTSGTIATVYTGAGYTYNPSTATFNIGSGGKYEINGTQIACGDLSNGATGCSTATGTSGSTIALNNGNNTSSGNVTYSGQSLFTGGLPTLSGGQTALGASSTGGGILRGDGSTDDLILQNKSSTNVCVIGTGATTLNCTGLQVGGTSVLTANQSITLSGIVTGSGTTAITTAFGSFSSATLATALTDETGAGVAVFGTAPTFTTSITDPLVIGGTGASSTLTLESTSGSGTTDAISFKTGSQAEAMHITTTGSVGIGTSTPTTDLQVSGAFNSIPSTLTISTSTFTPVLINSNTFRVVLVHASCPCTIANPSGTAVDGQRFILELWQSATGGDTVSFGGNYDFGTVGAPTLSTGASAGDFLGFSYSAQNSKYNYIGIQQGM